MIAVTLIMMAFMRCTLLEPSPNCTFNVCQISPCANGGTCMLDSTCNFRCECHARFTGSTCMQVSDESKQDSTETEKVSQIHKKRVSNVEDEKLGNNKPEVLEPMLCPLADGPGICQNGRCVQIPLSGDMCVCDKGWTGSLCDTSLRGPPEEPEHFTSLMDSVLAQAADIQQKLRKPKFGEKVLLSHLPIEHKLSINSKQTNKTISSQQTSTVTTAISVETIPLLDNLLVGSYVNACAENITLRPLSERKCPNQPEDRACVYGTCKQEVVDHGSWKGLKFTCNCDLGARG